MNWLKQLFARRRRYDELSETIREHLDEKIADLMDRGMTRDEAERTAHREFGNVTRIEERGREVWQWPRTESVLSGIRFALRQLIKSPGFAITAVLTLALGVGEYDDFQRCQCNSFEKAAGERPWYSMRDFLEEHSQRL